MTDDTPLTQDMLSVLLRLPTQMEEDRHPWGLAFSVNSNLPLLRTWDHFSGSRPNRSGCLLSRAPRERLSSSSCRKTFLGIHAAHHIWKPTPFISFTQSPRELQQIANTRRRGIRGSQTITVVNPNVRIEKGLPILNMDAEMSYYGVSDPYDESSRYYKNHLICLWEVTAEEVVGHWKWDDLLKIDCWYEQVILPAFEEHNDKYRVSTETFKLGALWSALFES